MLVLEIANGVAILAQPIDKGDWTHMNWLLSILHNSTARASFVYFLGECAAIHPRISIRLPITVKQFSSRRRKI